MRASPDPDGRPEAPGGPPGASHARRRAAIGLLAVGALLRVAIALLSRRVTPFTDMAWYLEASRAIASGAGLSTTVDRPLLYPVFLAGLARAGLGSLGALYLAQSALTLAAVAAVAWYASRICGARAGWLAAGLLAPQLTIAQYSGLLLSESLFLPLFAVWLALAWPLGAMADGGPARAAPGDEGRHGRAPGGAGDVLRIAAAGIAAGIAGAVRPAALPLAAGTCLALGVIGKGRGAHRARSAGTFAVAAAGALALAVLASARIAGVPPSLAPTAGVNLYLGNGPGARLDGGGATQLPPSLDAIPDPGARNAEAGRQAAREMARHPLRAAMSCVVRLLRLASVNPGRVEHDALVADGLPSPIVIAWLALEWIGLAVLAAGAWRAGAIPRPAGLFTILVAAPYVLVLTLTYVQTRYRLPLVPLLAPFAAMGLARLVGAERTEPAGGGARRLAPAGLFAGALILAATAIELLLKRL